ncbi:hypothetical protein G7051_17600 [Dysgonomonas sp. HDW5B]|uniref:hypothetical protein n=1 Tax=Dysgonomonas sp. HDW5B TaxID=2714927 RepID=UPI00140CD009|nr:hypothetical protein [Dysgonomonas sp. HDW5B]QIK56076.1 hypothetical protein G7051_17600 [Dysgonomonas sp. HDW5B]
MSIIIRLKESGEVFDVIAGFKLELNNTSPFFNDLGTKSVTTTLPNTPHNRRLFSFSNRMDTTNKPRSKMSVIVESGSYIREGVLYEVQPDNPETSFGVIIAFNEGIMYEAMSDILLTQLSNLPVVVKSVSDLIDDMNTLLKTDDLNTDLTIFPAILKGNSYTKDDTEIFQYEYLNMVEFVGPSLIERTTTDVLDDGKPLQIEVPAGYGITPFIRVWKVLELIFSHFGYNIVENPFKTDFQLQRLCLANNTLDTIVGGEIRYEQLLPRVTIMQFLQSLYGRFGLRVFFDSNRQEVNLHLLRTTFRDKSYTPVQVSSHPYPSPPIPKQLKLSGARGLDRSATETDTLEEFLVKYGNTIGTYPYYSGQVDVGGVYFDRRTGLFYQISTINREEKLLSSIQFDWNKKVEGMETEEITSSDECLTMINYNGTILPYFGLDGTLMNSILTVNGNTINTDNDRIFAFVYDMGEAYSEILGEKEYQGFKYGSIFPFRYNSPDKLQVDRNGNIFKYALTFVGEYGAFTHFFSEYDAFLRHSNRLVKFNLHASTFILANLNFAEKRIVQNQPILLDKVNHEVGELRSQTVEVEARTMRLYEPYDLEKEHHLPVPDDIRFKWVLSDDQDERIQEKYDELYIEFRKEETDNPFFHRFLSLSKSIIDDPNPPSAVTFWFLPPTEQQYINNSTVGYRSHKCKVRFLHVYQENTGTIMSPNWITHSDDIDKEINYSSMFKPSLLV